MVAYWPLTSFAEYSIMTKGKYPLSVAIAIVIANMVGTGVFTSLGYQVGSVPSVSAILFLWLIGGLVALCGALCYAEIASVLQRSGGEYHYLSHLIHPSIGFLSGWTSMMVGFAGAVSAVALAIGDYSSTLIPFSGNTTAVIAILLVTSIHLFGVRVGGKAQNIFTGFKLILILFFCVSPFIFKTEPSENHFTAGLNDIDLITSTGWAVSLVFVVYAYSGWNASSYIAGAMENPGQNLPKSLILGTVAVIVIYITLNSVFLGFTEFHEIEGKSDIGNILALKIFGASFQPFFSALFSIALLSTLSAMTIAGPRVAEAIGEDYPALKILMNKNRFGMPWLAILFQCGWSIFLVLTSSFTQIIKYVSVSLSWFTLLTVISLFILRNKKSSGSSGFKVPWYPMPPVIFISVTSWMIYYTYVSDLRVILYSIGTLLPGIALYWIVSNKKTA